MAADEILRYPQTEACSLGAAGHERIENGIADFREHAGTVVLELNRRHQAMPLGTDADTGSRAGSKHHARRPHAAVRQRLNGVAAEVQHRLNDVVGIDGERRQAGIVVAIDDKPFGSVAAQQMIDALQQLVDVHELFGRGASRAEH